MPAVIGQLQLAEHSGYQRALLIRCVGIELPFGHSALSVRTPVPDEPVVPSEPQEHHARLAIPPAGSSLRLASTSRRPQNTADKLRRRSSPKGEHAECPSSVPVGPKRG